MRAVRTLLGLSLASCLALAAPALAGQRTTLKDDLSASGPEVRLGDLFDNAGTAASVVVGRATGPTLVLDAQQVQAIARSRGLDWANPNGYRRLVIRVAFEAAPALAGPSASDAAARTAVATVATEKTVEVLTWSHSVAAGDVIRQEDVTWTRQPARLIPADAARDPDLVVGLAARHALREGAPVAAHDLATLKVVHRDQQIEVVFNVDGVRLVLAGQALGDAAVGETVQVLNTQSKKTIEAIATGPGRAAVGASPDAPRPQHLATNP
jgi:flagella basal body P-ring formation protein FlgA